MKKKRVLGFIVSVALILLAFFINESRTFTLEEFIQDHLDDGDEIEYVRITSDMYMLNKSFTTKIEDPALIDKFTTGFLMELKRNFTSSTPSTIEYPHEVHVQGKSSSFSFLFNGVAIHTDKKYQLDDLNPLFYIIEMEDLDWRRLK